MYLTLIYSKFEFIQIQMTPKEIIISNLVIARDQFIFTYLSLGYFIHNKNDFRGYGLVLNYSGQHITLADSEYLDSVISNDEVIKAITDSAKIGLKRNLMNNIHEMIQDYCGRTKQVDIFSKQPWYPFARVFRNHCSHHIVDRVIDWPKNYREKGIREVSWNDKVIKEGMLGKDIKMNEVEVFNLVTEMIIFVDKELK